MEKDYSRKHCAAHCYNVVENKVAVAGDVIEKSTEKDYSLKRCATHCYDVVEKKVAVAVDLKADSRGKSEEEQVNNKNLYMCFTICGLEDHVWWYKIDSTITSSNNDPTLGTKYDTIAPICTIPGAEIGRCFGTIALGSKIYMVGGYLPGGQMGMEGSSAIFSFATCASPLVWKREPTALLAKRGNPALVATHGKVFIFGCNMPEPIPWAEVFDPESNTCSALPPPPPEIPTSDPYGRICTALIAQGDQILLSISSKYLITFDVRTNTWLQITTPLADPGLWTHRGMVEDDMGFMFTFLEGSVFAYDLSTRKWLKDEVQGLDIASMSVLPKDELSGGQVVNLGNKIFSLVWNDNGENFSVVVRCVQFQVTRINNSLHAHLLARSSYHVTEGNYIVDCFPM